MTLSNFSTRVYSKLYRSLKTTRFAAIGDLRSSSDSGYYPEFVRQAAMDSRTFATFKRHPVYTQILEHVSEEQGAAYISEIKRLFPELLTRQRVEQFKVNDQVGAPFTCSYPETGEISPTTLRYMKVASDLRTHFKDLSGMNVAEIGVGYGGQLLIADMIYKLGSWTLFDLDPVLSLTSRYLESHLLRTAYKPTTLNRFDDRGVHFDLVISNYAFSELPKVLQARYIEKVVSKSKRGYLTMNSGKTAGNGRHMTIEELRGVLPDFQTVEEVPLTFHDNYIIVWGK